jgi:hypothetical protein
MRIWIASLLFCIVRSQYINDYPCPHPCDCSVSYDSEEPIVDVFCTISSINGNQTDFIVNLRRFGVFTNAFW